MDRLGGPTVSAKRRANSADLHWRAGSHGHNCGCIQPGHARGLLAGGRRAECAVRGVVVHWLQGEFHPIQAVSGHLYGGVGVDFVGDFIVTHDTIG